MAIRCQNGEGDAAKLLTIFFNHLPVSHVAREVWIEAVAEIGAPEALNDIEPKYVQDIFSLEVRACEFDLAFKIFKSRKLPSDLLAANAMALLDLTKAPKDILDVGREFREQDLHRT